MKPGWLVKFAVIAITLGVSACNQTTSRPKTDMAQFIAALQNNKSPVTSKTPPVMTEVEAFKAKRVTPTLFAIGKSEDRLSLASLKRNGKDPQALLVDVFNALHPGNGESRHLQKLDALYADWPELSAWLRVVYQFMAKKDIALTHRPTPSYASCFAGDVIAGKKLSQVERQACLANLTKTGQVYRQFELTPCLSRAACDSLMDYVNSSQPNVYATTKQGFSTSRVLAYNAIMAGNMEATKLAAIAETGKKFAGHDEIAMTIGALDTINEASPGWCANDCIPRSLTGQEVLGIPNSAGYTARFALFASLPASFDHYLTEIYLHSDTILEEPLPTPYLFDASRRLIARNTGQALELRYAALLRAHYDSKRCVGNRSVTGNIHKYWGLYARTEGQFAVKKGQGLPYDASLTELAVTLTPLMAQAKRSILTNPELIPGGKWRNAEPWWFCRHSAQVMSTIAQNASSISPSPLEKQVSGNMTNYRVRPDYFPSADVMYLSSDKWPEILKGILEENRAGLK